MQDDNETSSTTRNTANKYVRTHDSYFGNNYTLFNQEEIYLLSFLKIYTYNMYV